MGFQGLNSASQPNEWKGVYDKMRPLKFRGWDKEKKQWTSPCSGSQGKVELMIFDTPGIEVTQFTGLLDCHGKEIWEGDIVGKEVCSKDDPAHGFYKELYKVLWFDEGAGFIFQKIDNFDDCWCPNSVSTSNQFEVIGNIYENPELLE